MKKTLAISLVLLASTSVFGQNKYETLERIQNTIRLLAPIKSYVETVENLVEKSDGPDVVVTNVAGYNDSEVPVWKWYGSQNAFEVDNPETYTTVFLWKKDGRIVQANFTYSSPSGDWVEYIYHTFYTDGTAAKIDREIRTFMGDVIVNRVSFYDVEGTPIAINTSYRDLATREYISEPESFMDMSEPFYLKLDDMPFWQKPLSGPVN